MIGLTDGLWSCLSIVIEVCRQMESHMGRNGCVGNNRMSKMISLHYIILYSYVLFS